MTSDVSTVLRLLYDGLLAGFTASLPGSFRMSWSLHRWILNFKWIFPEEVLSSQEVCSRHGHLAIKEVWQPRCKILQDGHVWSFLGWYECVHKTMVPQPTWTILFVVWYIELLYAVSKLEEKTTLGIGDTMLYWPGLVRVQVHVQRYVNVNVSVYVYVKVYVYVYVYYM